MHFDKLGIFVDLVRLRSFSAVARFRNIETSSVSRTISTLESELGVRLFERTTRKFSTTEAGQQYYDQILPLLEGLESAKEKIKQGFKTPSGLLRITAPVSLSLQRLVPLVSKFQRLYPEVNVDFIVTDSRLDLVNEKIDLALRFGTMPDSILISQKLFSLDNVICASPDYLSTSKNILKPSDLFFHNCLQFLNIKDSNVWTFKTTKGSPSETILVSGNLKLSNALGLKQAALGSAGITLLPRFLVAEEIRAGELIELFKHYKVTTGDGVGGEAWLVYPSRKYLPLKTSAFISFLRKEFSA